MNNSGADAEEMQSLQIITKMTSRQSQHRHHHHHNRRKPDTFWTPHDQQKQPEKRYNLNPFRIVANSVHSKRSACASVFSFSFAAENYGSPAAVGRHKGKPIFTVASS